MKYVLGIACLVYLLFPTLGVFELIPDALPIVGHLDELAVTFLMTNFFGLALGRDEERPALPKMLIYIAFGMIALIYLMYPSFSAFELIPDAVPVAGNIDEIIASLLLTYVTQSVRTPRKSKNDDQTMMVDGELANEQGQVS